MRIGGWLVDFSLRRYRLVAALVVAVTLLVAALAAVPSVAPGKIPFLKSVSVDTDPENMLSADEPVRVFHDEMKHEMALHDMVVVGVVNESHPDGVYNPLSLSRVYALTEYAKTLSWVDDEGKPEGVIEVDLLAPSVVDTIEPGGVGEIRFEWLMRTPPTTAEEALEVRRKAERIPFLYDTLVSGDGKAIALYLPLTRKDLSHRVYKSLRTRMPILWIWAPLKAAIEEKYPAGGARDRALDFLQTMAFRARDEAAFREALLALARSGDESALTKVTDRVFTGELPSVEGIFNALAGGELAGFAGVVEGVLADGTDFPGDDRFYITGLPVAEDTFGVEMFIQMAVSAPVAMFVIFVLMLIFFRKLILIISPLIVAMVSVILTMGALIIAGFPIHIMSSMIPIFIMPIAVLDSVHIISEFFEKYRETKDRKKTVTAVMEALFMPMLYTSLTSAAGFASLALTPIPPVQVFGVFVAVGIMAAWLLTVVFIPAFIMFIPPRWLENFGATHSDSAKSTSALGRLLERMGLATYSRAKVIIAMALVVMVVSAYGIGLIDVNDNPVKWFTKSHPIREADRVMNAHFGGTYMAYLALSGEDRAFDGASAATDFAAKATAAAGETRGMFSAEAEVDEVFLKVAGAARDAGNSSTAAEFYAEINRKASEAAASASGETSFVWDEAITFVEREKLAATEIFKDPAVLSYMSNLQQTLLETGIVGKSNSLADIVKTVYRDLVTGPGEDESANFRIPSNRRMVAESLIQFQNSHRPQDLWHFVTPDYTRTSIWVQLKSGDNRDMAAVKSALDEYIKNNPPPTALSARWFGLTYINVVWQEKMVTGMLQAFAGSFLVVFLLMAILFRSALWGFLSMIPLTVTIVAIYGAIGIIGKDYDMPVAVLSSLTLGLAVDFAIHLLARARNMYGRFGSWRETAPHVFGEPARAIARNIIVIAAGFLPLLLAPLVPYRTVGALLAIILLLSGLSTLLLLPALMRLMEKRLFASLKTPMGSACNCGLCIALSAAAVALVALNLHQYAAVGWSKLTWMSVVAVPILALLCGLLSRREKCRVAVSPADEEVKK